MDEHVHDRTAFHPLCIGVAEKSCGWFGLECDNWIVFYEIWFRHSWSPEDDSWCLCQWFPGFLSSATNSSKFPLVRHNSSYLQTNDSSATFIVKVWLNLSKWRSRFGISVQLYLLPRCMEKEKGWSWWRPQANWCWSDDKDLLRKFR